MNTAMQLSTHLSTNPNGSLGDYKPWRRATGEAGNIILNSLAKTPNRKEPKYPQFADGKALTTDKGLCNDDDFFEHFIQDNAAPDPEDKLYKCSKGFIWGESSQNNFYKMLCCGKEWCPDCGKKHSIPHDRRINRHSKVSGQTLLENFLALHQNHFPIQYLVVTIPKELRSYYRSHEALSRFRIYWKDKLKREGHQYGFCRYHYCGEDGYYWKPHLNILTIGGFVAKEELRQYRAEIARWFKMEHKLNYLPQANIYTAYTHDANKIRHWLTYITRATQTKYNKENEEVIKGFRNSAPFKDENFTIPKYQKEEKEKEPVQQAAAEGYDLLPDGTKEKIVWRMKYDEFKKRWRPEVVLIEHTRINELQLIRRGFWREEKIHKPPPDTIPENSFCPF